MSSLRRLAVGAWFGLMLWGGFTPAASASLVGGHVDDLAGVQIPLDESCIALQADGAEDLRILSPVEQPGEAILLGLGNGIVRWAQRLPWQADHGGFNAAKTWGSCEGRELTLYSQVPYGAATFIQMFEWNGQELRFLSHDFADASAEILEAAIVAVETQGAPPAVPEGLESPFEGLLYPHRYIHAASIETAIARGHAAALARYQAGEPEVAAKILRDMFELTRSLQALVGYPQTLASFPELAQWVGVWWDQGLEFVSYGPALNDYGFFLQEAGQHRDAIAIFEAVVELAPQRTVAHLNLADSHWALGQSDAARRSYETYRWQMAQQGLAQQIPARVLQRL